MSFADGLFTSQHSRFVCFFSYSTAATGVTAWPNIYYVFEGSRKKTTTKKLGSSAPPTVCTLSVCFGRTILLAAERLFSFLIGSAASRIHCPCVLHANSQTPCCFVLHPPSQSSRSIFVTLRYVSAFSLFLYIYLLRIVDQRQHSWLNIPVTSTNIFKLYPEMAELNGFGLNSFLAGAKSFENPVWNRTCLLWILITWKLSRKTWNLYINTPPFFV